MKDEDKKKSIGSNQNQIEVSNSTNVDLNQQIIHGDYIQYQEKKISQFLTKLPLPENVVIGRRKELDSLYDTLESSQNVVLMNGMGGIGKTTLAMAYTNRYKNKYKHIVWVEQLGDFTTDLATNSLLTQNLGVTPSNNPEVDAKYLLNKLTNLEGKSLLVLDNVNHQVNAYKDYLPKAPDWHVLITSRESLSFTKMISLGFLSEEDALELFYIYYKLDKDDRRVKNILQAIDYHTLTLEILAKTAQKRKINSIQELQKLLEDRGLQIGRRVDIEINHSKGKKIKRLFPYLQAIFEMEEDMSMDEIFLLKQFIALPPIFITWDLLVDLLQLKQEDESKWDDLTVAIDALTEKGWLLMDKQHQSYKMHRIIQEVLQEKLRPTYKELQNLINGISSKLEIDESKDNPIDKFPFVAFGEQIIKLGINSNSNSKDESFTWFESNLAMVYQNLGNYKKAKDLMELALASSIANFGEQHSNTAIKRSNLAMVYQNLGNYKKAKDLMELALASSIANFPEQHTSIATNRSNLAMVYQNLGNYKKAKDLMELALISDITNFGEEHPNTTIKRSNLGLVYKALGDYEKARDLMELALASDITNFGEQHPDTAIKRSNLAMVYRALGDYEKARDLMELALASDIANFGEQHPDTAIKRSNLGLVYKTLGDYEKARDLIKAALVSDIANFGEQYPSTAVKSSNLGLVYKALGDYEKARDLIKAALVSDIANFGEQHPNTALTRSNLGLVYKTMGDYEKARDLWEESYNTFKLYLGKNHSKTRTVKEWLDNL